MAELSAECVKALARALQKRHRDDSLERAVGREVRRAGLSYHDYMNIMETIRSQARKHKLDMWELAKLISEQQKEQ